MGAEITIDSFDELEKSLLLINEYLKEEMIAELQRQGHDVTGNLINSITEVIVRDTDFIRMDGMFIFYGPFVDRGRKAGVRKVPIDALMDWIQKKGFETDIKKVKGMAFAIQKTIFDKGVSQEDSWHGTDTANFMTGTLLKEQKRIDDDVFNSVNNVLELIIFNIVQDTNQQIEGNTTTL